MLAGQLQREMTLRSSGSCRRSFQDSLSHFNTNRYFFGGGQLGPCHARHIEECLCSHHNNTALIKQLSLFDTALVITKKNFVK